MGKNKNKNKNKEETASPEAEAKRVMLHAKSNAVDVFSSTVDLGQKADDMLKCLMSISQEMSNLSVILISAGDKQVLVGCLSAKDEIKVDEWVAAATSCIPKSDQANTELEVEDKTKFKVMGVFVGGEAFPIKEKESSLANSFSYLKKNNLVPDDESSDEEMGFNLNDIEDDEPEVEPEQLQQEEVKPETPQEDEVKPETPQEEEEVKPEPQAEASKEE